MRHRTDSRCRGAVRNRSGRQPDRCRPHGGPIGGGRRDPCLRHPGRGGSGAGRCARTLRHPLPARAARERRRLHGGGALHATGALPLLVATLGPGVANAVNVAANAQQDRVPLIVVTGCGRSGPGRKLHASDLRPSGGAASARQGELPCGARHRGPRRRQGCCHSPARAAGAGPYRPADRGGGSPHAELRLASRPRFAAFPAGRSRPRAT